MMVRVSAPTSVSIPAGWWIPAMASPPAGVNDPPALHPLVELVVADHLDETA